MLLRKYKKLYRILTNLSSRKDLGVTSKEDDELALLTKSLLQLPKKAYPEAIKRRKYLTSLTTPKAVKWASAFRLLTLTTSGLLLLLIVMTGMAVNNSKPGNSLLYSYKKTAERLRITFASTPQRKIDLELALTQKRLNEVREVIATNPNNRLLTAAALTELAHQTETVVASVSEAVKQQTIPASTKVAGQLDSLAKDQLALLNSIKANPETEPAAMQALTATQQTTKQAATIHQIIAATNEESLIKTQDTDIIAGTITNLSQTSITIDSTELILNADTIIKSGTSDKPITKIILKTKVSATVRTQGEKHFAKEITIISLNTEEQSKEEQPKKAEANIKPLAPKIDTEPLAEQKAQGTFISEDPLQGQ